MNQSKKKKRQRDLDLLFNYSIGCNFIIETGAGESTKYLAKATKGTNAKLVSIELSAQRCVPMKGVEFVTGWSVDYDDIVKIGEKDFVDVEKWKKRLKKNKDYIDGKVAHKNKSVMKGKKNLIREVLQKNKDRKLDFFFCDSGEYCGLAEWNIVKDEIKIGGYFAIHDIYYPKSIKGFKVVKKIKKDNRWVIKEQTNSVQGLLIAKKIK